ncbi:MAG: AMP-binding protein [Candidatus Obscuribacter sp.]|nr:AMP-binding protein [Candidatus Obscuribacter sp.]
MQANPFAHKTPLFDLLAHSATTSGDSPCIDFGQYHYSYRAIYSLAVSFARLIESKVKPAPGPKTTVAIYLPNSDLFVAAFFGLSALGVTIVPVNPMLKSDEIAHILSDSQASVLILSEDLYKQVTLSANQSLCTIVVVKEQDEPLPDPASGLALVQFTRGQLDSKLPVVCYGQQSHVDESPCLIVYTSGTTGRPKGAVLSHKNVQFTINAYPHILQLTGQDRLLAILPFCHLYGLLVVLVGAIKDGAALSVLAHFEPHKALQAISQERVTVLPAVPTMYHFMLLAMQEHYYDLSSLRLAVTGGAPMPDGLMLRVQEALPVHVLEGYALTETTVIATLNPKDKCKLGSVGLPFSGVQIGVRDNLQNLWLGPGPEQVGEICIKGACIMQGYLNNPFATSEAIKDGWLYTGDLGYVDSEGYVFINGRSKELIVRGGMNVYPREVEEVLLHLESVAEAAVVGVPDANMGERVKACIVLKQGQQLNEGQVQAHCRAHLADYKLPRTIVFMSALPKNSTGKVLKRLL